MELAIQKTRPSAGVVPPFRDPLRLAAERTIRAGISRSETPLFLTVIVTFSNVLVIDLAGSTCRRLVFYVSFSRGEFAH